MVGGDPRVDANTWNGTGFGTDATSSAKPEPEEKSLDGTDIALIAVAAVTGLATLGALAYKNRQRISALWRNDVPTPKPYAPKPQSGNYESPAPKKTPSTPARDTTPDNSSPDSNMEACKKYLKEKGLAGLLQDLNFPGILEERYAEVRKNHPSLSDQEWGHRAFDLALDDWADDYLSRYDHDVAETTSPEFKTSFRVELSIYIAEHPGKKELLYHAGDCAFISAVTSTGLDKENEPLRTLIESGSNDIETAAQLININDRHPGWWKEGVIPDDLFFMETRALKSLNAQYPEWWDANIPDVSSDEINHINDMTYEWEEKSLGGVTSDLDKRARRIFEVLYTETKGNFNDPNPFSVKFRCYQYARLREMDARLPSSAEQGLKWAIVKALTKPELAYDERGHLRPPVDFIIRHLDLLHVKHRPIDAMQFESHTIAEEEFNWERGGGDPAEQSGARKVHEQLFFQEDAEFMSLSSEKRVRACRAYADNADPILPREATDGLSWKLVMTWADENPSAIVASREVAYTSASGKVDAINLNRCELRELTIQFENFEISALAAVDPEKGRVIKVYGHLEVEDIYQRSLDDDPALQQLEAMGIKIDTLDYSSGKLLDGSYDDDPGYVSIDVRDFNQALADGVLSVDVDTNNNATIVIPVSGTGVPNTSTVSMLPEANRLFEDPEAFADEIIRMVEEDPDDPALDQIRRRLRNDPEGTRRRLVDRIDNNRDSMLDGFVTAMELEERTSGSKLSADLLAERALRHVAERAMKPAAVAADAPKDAAKGEERRDENVKEREERRADIVERLVKGMRERGIGREAVK